MEIKCILYMKGMENTSWSDKELLGEQSQSSEYSIQNY